MKPIHTIEGISEYRLENGLQVLLIPDPSRSSVTVNLTVFVGSRHEGYGEAGMAHLLEHMLFKGTPTHRSIPELMKARGASFNGTTWLDRTNFYETLPATSPQQAEENLRFALALEADRLLNSLIDADDFASEMTVVRNEFERGENNSRRILAQRVQSIAYDWHNYGRSTIGNQSDIERVPVESLRKFYRKFYRPDNCLLVVSGCCQVESALTGIQDSFGGLTNPSEPLDRTYTIEPAQDGERTVVLRRVGNTQYVCLSYHVPCGASEEFAAVEMLAYIFGTEPTGRLYQDLVVAEIASDIATSSYALHDPGIAKFEVQLPMERSLEKAQEAMLECIEGVTNRPITEEELNRAKAQFLRDRTLRANDSTVLAIDLSDWAAQGDWRLYFLFRDYIQQVTAEQCTAAAVKYFTRSNRTLGLFIPTPAVERVEMPVRPDLDALLQHYEGQQDMQQGEFFDPSPAAIESKTTRQQLACGLKAALLSKRTRGGTTFVEVNLRYGNEESLQGLVEATEFLPELILRGTRSLDYQALQDHLDLLQSNAQTSGATGLISLSLESTRANLDQLIPLAVEMMRYPKLDETEFELIRRQAIAAVESRMHEPSVLASIALRRAMLTYEPTDVRYVPTLQERIERYENLTIVQIQQLHQRLMSGDSGELAIVGDFESETILNQINVGFDCWRSSTEFRRIDYPAQILSEGSLQVIQTPDKRNAVYYAGMQLPMSDEDPANPALTLANFIFGGSALTSRLGDRVRQGEGMSYSIGSSLHAHPIDQRATFGISAIMSPSDKDKMIAIIREELVRLVQDGITEEELTTAKAGYLQSEQLGRTSDENVVSLLANTIFAKRTMLHYEQEEQAIERLSKEEVNAQVAKFIDPNRLQVVVAGDF
ncbi:MAG: pitrilysin family protein [Pirellulales bacterium]